MKVNIKPITGNWDLGYAMDKHLIKSTYLGDNEYGKPMFQNDRTEVGEAVYQLKYQNDMDQVDALAQCLLVNAVPLFQNIQLIIPMAASNVRKIQPVTAITDALASKIGNNMFSFNELLIKAPGGVSLKNLNTKEEKEVAVADAFSYQNQIVGDGPFNALIVDDLFHTGASMEAAVTALRGYNKINKIYVAALTWR
ncbi:TPA: ComF family protein [Escherichia coli]|nr:ComF family protein [Escherichia coli]ELE3010766.1 ComF family protein [Escherichia coli]HAX2084881.1 ComF family protein [Escherichia coli]HBQ4480273.1 ComF family protein [Escherichia coli]HEB5756827.1 ComF family protein [Escherichia coli]